MTNSTYAALDQFIERNQTNSIKWDARKAIFGTDDVLPMWVADMDFAVPKEVTEAIIKRAEHPVYAYTKASDTLLPTIKRWLNSRYNWDPMVESFLFTPGVVNGFGTAIQACTKPGDKILIQPPVYPPFFHSVEKLQREVVKSELILVDHQFTIDFDDFEAKLKNGVKAFLFCSPHNPGGRVWSKEELETIVALCRTYNVTIISDEIHADLTLSHSTHHPIATIDPEYREQIITIMAPSKTFNIAGLQASFFVVEGEELREKIQNVQAEQSFHGLNLFALTAMEAAFQSGEPWLKELISYLEENIAVADQFIQQELPELSIMKPDASFLLWIDCRKLKKTDDEIRKLLIEKGKLGVDPGTKYGSEGTGFIRMNIGCTRNTLLEGLKRLKTALS